nr:GIY-YIG nuclease family protein [Seongchinamella sediminis]
MLASKRHGTIYIGVTSNLVRRIWQHRNHVTAGFTARYCVNRLVWFELCSSMYDAIQYEKRLKNWKREWKIELIEERNPAWLDLWGEVSSG